MRSNRFRESIKEFAQIVVREDDQWITASGFMCCHSSSKKVWRAFTLFLMELMKRVKTVRQASRVSHLLDEFMPLNTPRWVLRNLRELEQQMYQRLNSVWGTKKCMVQHIASTQEGRAFLRTQQ